MAERPATATSPLLRRLNATVVLDALREAESMTVTEVMAVTGLSRPTVHTVCDELARLGWVREIDGHHPDDVPRRGRRARRYAFHARGGYVVGVDLGANKVTVLLSDLAGTAIGQESRHFRRRRVSADERLDAARAAVAEVLRHADVGESAVLAVGLAVPGSVDPDGNVKVSDWWLPGQVGTDLRAALAERFEWPVLVENDANLAVLGERWQGVATEVDDVVLLLAGERLGAGVFIGGRLVRGAHGGAGELGFLDLVHQVGTADGIGMLTRELGAQAVKEAVGQASPSLAPDTLLGLTEHDPDLVLAETVFAAVRAGDPVATAVVDAVAARIARVVTVLTTLLDPELVVIGGAVADAGDVLLEPLEREIAALCERPPRLRASALGDHAVVAGAVQVALDHVKAGIFERGALEDHGS